MTDLADRAREFLSDVKDAPLTVHLYAADELIQFMRSLADELDRLRALQRDGQDTAKQAIAERDAALAKFARVEALAGDWYDSVPMWALREALTGEAVTGNA